MSNEPIAYINIEERRLQWAGPVKWDTPIITKMDKIPLYTHPINPKYDPETGEPLIDGYPLFSGLPHPIKELDEQFKKGFEAGKEEGWKAHKFHHPAKDLTDEEIVNIGYHYGELGLNLEMIRAILRKAQEK